MHKFSKVGQKIAKVYQCHAEQCVLNMSKSMQEKHDSGHKIKNPTEVSKI